MTSCALFVASFEQLQGRFLGENSNGKLDGGGVLLVFNDLKVPYEGDSLFHAANKIMSGATWHRTAPKANRKRPPRSVRQWMESSTCTANRIQGTRYRTCSLKQEEHHVQCHRFSEDACGSSWT
jgi:hypothetical protein